ncbi:transcriptional regulator domain-containing protein [Mesorhizobium sp. B1-1-8]|uniref:transcriptional regulator domain-containing protein n=1 Tax=Mesorhizobium sp. B1-1-8 TaxID=2589976 RepID=UPI001D00739C|nr:DUF6499 domain-containing protein [Mesorhizobium sp. B1-1-8]UCI05222.1 DUF6499 domain-containing protein [Mesorhizobium sp. B1-1-8]
MRPDASGWRSPNGYDHVEDMAATDLAWEWLRRNDSYDKDFEELKEMKGDTRPLTDAIRQRWRLRFPGGPAGCPARSSRDLAPAGRHRRHRSHRGACGPVRKHCAVSENRRHSHDQRRGRNLPPL